MEPKSSVNRIVRSALLGSFAIAVFFAVFQSRLRAALGILQSPSKSLVALNMKFNGAEGCKSPSCHGATDPAAAPARHGDEYTVWANKDKHHDAYKTLTTDPLSASIAKKLGMSSAATSSECLSCHALSVPAALQSTKYNVKEGVSCNSCHGPSEKWLSVHSQKGWIDKQRLAIPDHEKLLQTYGIYDTQPVLARADRCTSCHLAMDAKLVTAGHPQPVFELAYFSEVEPKHWREPDGLFITKLWATGQATCLRDAMVQVGDRADAKAPTKSTIDQMRGHYLMFKEVAAIVDPAAAAKLDAAITALITLPSSGAAKTAAGLVADMAPSVSKYDFTAPKTAKILKAILSSDATKKIGADAQLQQAEGAYELFNAYATGASVTDQPASDAAAALLPPDKPSGPLDPAYDKNLKDARAKILPLLK